MKTSTVMLPTRIQVGHKALPDDEKFLSLPFVADGWGESGIYFMPRRGNKQLVFGSVAHRFESEIVEDPDNYNTALDPDVKQDYLNCLHHRLPDLPSSGQIQGFSHMYTVNKTMYLSLGHPLNSIIIIYATVSVVTASSSPRCWIVDDKTNNG